MKRLEAAFAVLGREHFEAFLAQRVTERVTQIRVVVDENDPCHLRPSLPSASNVHREFTER
jgi:hypothetical protein